MRKLTYILSLSLFIGLTSCEDDKEKVEDIKIENKEVPKVNNAEKTKSKTLDDFEKPYHPEDDAKAKIDELVMEAEIENKNILLQIGGNWCIWCLRFNEYVQNTPELKKIVDENYLYYHLNYSKENKNEDLMAEYGNPGKKYGFPVFVILDQNGNQIHTQGSGEFEGERDNYYELSKVKDFLTEWSPK